MSLLVTGSIGIDNVSSPFGQADGILGGSAVYFSFSAALFSPVRLVGVVGDDFPQAFRDLLADQGFDLTGLETRAGSKTFRWEGKYEGDMNEATTLATDLNVLGEAGPEIPPQFRDSQYVFLANTHPTLQRDLLGQLDAPELAVCDTMNLWIENERDALLKTLGKVNGVVLNDGEARMLTGESNLITAGRRMLDFGPQFVVIKKGEHGSMLVTGEELFVLPAFPAETVRDPTGAGDSFAGGFMGYINKMKNRLTDLILHRAVCHGAVMASFTVEDFSLDRLKKVRLADIKSRLQRLARTVSPKA